MMASVSFSGQEFDFAGLFGLEELQRIQDAFAEATGVASIITRPDGVPITEPSNFCRLCAEIIRNTERGRANCFKSDSVLGRYVPEGPTIKACLSGGLWDAGASIHVEGRHVANWLIGQIRDEDMDTQSMLAYADEIGADREDFREALEEVPLMTREHFRKVAEALFLLANQLSRQAYLIRKQQDLLRESRLAGERLRKSEDRFRTIFDSVSELIFIHDPETGGILDVNRRACDEYGYPKDEMLGLNVAGLSQGVPPFDQDHARKAMLRAMEEGPQLFEWRARRRDGSLFWLEVSIRLASIGGEGRLVVSARNVSDRVAAQAEFQREKAFTDAIMNSVPGLLYLYDDQGRLVRWNKKHEELTGYSSEELSRMTLAGWYKDAPDEYGKVLQAIGRMEEAGFSDVEASLGNKDGSRRLYYLTGVPLELEGRRYMAGIGIDIAERKRMQELMVQTEKMMTVAGLAAGMAHEINNPLSAVLQGMQVLEQRLGENLPRNEEVAARCGCTMRAISEYIVQRGLGTIIVGIRDAGKRAAAVVSNMLEFSRRGESARAPNDIGALLDKSVELCSNDYDLKKKYDFRKMEIERVYDPELPRVRCTASQIEQVFLNLLKNAAQALVQGTHGRLPPRITLKTSRDADVAVIEIADNGPGMEEAVRGRVFEPFFTTKPPGEGTGLGLSVSYFIVVEAHGGSIRVESAPGAGSRFIVRLPLEPRR